MSLWGGTVQLGARPHLKFRDLQKIVDVEAKGCARLYIAVSFR